jgi:putative addiction module component (TIGR02574 family)
MASVDEHVKALLDLPPEERERVACLLLDSLEEDDSQELSPEWISEIRRRIDAVKIGSARLLPHEDVQRSVAAKLEEIRKRR